jgi:hypothetical protein
MPTPFAPFASLRLLWRDPTAKPVNLRDGPASAAVRLVVIEAYIDATPAGPTGQDAGGIEIGSQQLEGNITRWAVVPDGANWLDAGASWAWTDTGLRPPGFAAGTRLQAWEGPLSELPIATNGRHGWFTIGTLSGTGGIEAIVRAAAGDEFTGIFADGR